MKSPFIYGKIVTGTSFINREKEISRLSENFRNHLNCTLISPRRWGKTSLVKKTASLISDNNSDIQFCFLDLFRIRTEEEFYERYATEVIKSTSGKLDEWIKNIKDFLGRLSPSFSIGNDPLNDFQLSFNLLNLKTDKEEILNLPEKLAIKKKKHIVICIDEFQNIGNYNDSMEIQKLFRSVWQYHQNTSYCIYGSKRHMMMELFENQSMPFYKFGDVIYLQKIDRQHFIDFIEASFSKTGRSIDNRFTESLVDSMESHPYFVQQLAHILWVNTTRNVTDEVYKESVETLIAQNAILYQQIIDSLSSTQVNFLIALSKDVTNLNSAEILRKFNLGTSGNVSKIKKTLIQKEIIDTNNGMIFFHDPPFRIWLSRMF